MRTSTIIPSLLAVVFCASSALADDDHGHHDHANDAHAKYARTPHEHGYHSDRRSYDDVRRDPHFREGRHDYRPHRAWHHYHLSRGAWFRTWGIASWHEVGTITCEAVNQDTGQMYPVSADRAVDGWSTSGVNLILDQALDNCYADGGGAACVPIQPPCTQR
jgi:hypothetical protein